MRGKKKTALTLLFMSNTCKDAAHARMRSDFPDRKGFQKFSVIKGAMSTQRALNPSEQPGPFRPPFFSDNSYI